jgi:hypothetical protein
VVFESSQNSNSSGTSHPVNFKLTTSPENVGTEAMRGITTTSGLKPQGASFVTWSSIGGANGTIVISDSTTNSLFINQALGEGEWKVVRTNAARAYGREVHAGKLSIPENAVLLLTSYSARCKSASHNWRLTGYRRFVRCYGDIFELRTSACFGGVDN